MKVLVTGSSGFIGSALLPALTGAGHQVLRLVRHPPSGPDQVRWDPATGELDPSALAGVQAAVHLAGAGVGDRRWTPAYRQQIRDSRVAGTRTLVRALTQLDPLPSVLVSGSAVGYYGNRGEEELTEDSPGGEGFLPDVVRAWEAETVPAAKAGIRVAMIRTGLVMGPGGGSFGRLMALARLGLGGPLGNGSQWWPWITLADQVSAIRFLLDHDVSGPVNLSAPTPARQRDLARLLGHALHRPAVLPAPRIALRLVLGPFADDIVASQRMLPQRLSAAGFRFEHPEPGPAVQWLVDAAR